MNEANWLAYIEYAAFNTYDWVLVFALLFLSLEILNDIVTRRASQSRMLETLTSLFTQLPYYFTEAAVFGGAVYLYFMLYEVIPWQQPVNGYTMLFVLLLADLTYYVEHYALHRIRLFWLAHSVHHSSGMMNTATAFRFSLFDPVVSVIFHLPLVLMGFNPVIIFAAEVLVQAYQFWLHNEMIGKLGPLEWFLNTPSHHRVHHGADRRYLDKNFGGIFILWDRLFGTFREEDALPRYGLTTPMNSKNPFTVQFYEFMQLYRDFRCTKGITTKIRYLVKPPGWQPRER